MATKLDEVVIYHYVTNQKHYVFNIAMLMATRLITVVT